MSTKFKTVSITKLIDRKTDIIICWIKDDLPSSFIIWEKGRLKRLKIIS